MRIEAVASPGPEWDAFVESQPGAALGHASAWARVLGEAYGLETRFLQARAEGGALAGVLPLVRFRTLRARPELVSMPYLDTGGILAVDEAAERALLDAALALTRELRGEALELRQAAPLRAPLASPPVPRVDLVLDLPDDEEALWSALPGKVRNQTRKAWREGLELVEGDAHALVDAFYEPFAINMRDLGSPVHATAFYRVSAAAFGERLRVIAVRRGARCIGGLVAIDYAGAVHVPWASTLRSERSRCPNNLIYWEALRWAIARGARRFDFGRSAPDSGTYRFKRGWGAEEQPLAWLRLAPDGTPRPAALEGGGRLGRLAAIWARLPVPVANALGPRVRRRIAN